MVENPAASQEPQETRVWTLGPEDPREEEISTCSRILAWGNPTDRRAWWGTVHGVAKCRTRLGIHSQQHIHPSPQIFLRDYREREFKNWLRIFASFGDSEVNNLFCFLVILAKCLSSWFIFSETSFSFRSLLLCCSPFRFSLLQSVFPSFFELQVQFTLLFSCPLRCKFGLLVWDLSSFSMWCL